jgi:hypothetical protein
MLTEGGYLADPLSLAQRLMEKLQVDLTAEVSYAPEMYPLPLKLFLTLGRVPFLSPSRDSRMVLFRSIECGMDVKRSCLRVSL